MARETIVFRDEMQYADTTAFEAAWPGNETGQATYDLVNYNSTANGPRWAGGVKTVHMELLPVGVVLGPEYAWEFRTRTVSGLDPTKLYLVRAAFHMDANYPFHPKAGIEVRGISGKHRAAYSLLAEGTDYLDSSTGRTNRWQLLEVIAKPFAAGTLILALGGWHITGIMPRQSHWGLVEIAVLNEGPADDFMFDPDGQFPVEESLEYRTDVIVGRSGSEQRRRLRSVPRLRLSFTAQRMDADAALVDAQLQDNINGEWYVPWWPDLTPLTADVSSGATVIPCVHAGHQFVEGEELVVWRSPASYERRVIAAGGLGTSGQITVTAGLTSGWTVQSDTIVVPVKRTRLVEPELPAARPASFVTARPLTFEVIR